MLFVGAFGTFIYYRFTLGYQLENLREKLKIIASTAAVAVDSDSLASVPLNRSGIDTPQYKAIAEKLARIKSANLPIRYIYTMAKTDQPGILQFIVDPEPLTLRIKKSALTSMPGDKYDARRIPELLNAFKAPSADKEIVTDAWGKTLSGYAPIYDRQGKPFAILGVDILAPEVIALRSIMHKQAAFLLVLAVILSLTLGTSLSRTISLPIKILSRGTRRIAEGDLNYRFRLKRADEIGQLAKCLNDMAERLNESRNKINGYFYDVIQSLVRVLEARDHYTRGHSERVAELAGKVAASMRYAPEEIDILKETALLHDIGKFGIQESILNKKEKLTDEEWEIIRQHPLIGEEILRPIALDPQMLAIARGHHERFDGKGYPDNIKGDKIDLFAQILAIADAFDAMTSQRAYRRALSKNEAIQELIRNKGTQFNPQIVDIFIEVINNAVV